MKNTLLKVWGIVLTVAILAGLLISAAPVSAANLSWSVYGIPTVTVGTSANVFAFAATGKTVFMYDGKLLNQSNDAGLTWSSTNLNTNTPAIKAMVVDPTNAQNLVATNGVNVYRSQTGGVSWSVFNPPTFPSANAMVTSIDATTDAWGNVVLIGYDGAGYAGGVALYENGQWLTTWAAPFLGTNAANWGTAGTAASAYAVKLSPNYTSDYAVLAVAGNYTGFTLRTIISYVNPTTAPAWAGDMADAVLTTTPAMIGASLASIDTPNDFYWGSSATNHVFVGLGNTFASVNSSAYRVDGRYGGTPFIELLAGASSLNISSIDYQGTSTSGVLALGLYNSTTIYTSTDAVTQISGSGATWTTSTKSPTGTAIPNTLVRFAPTTTTLYAGTANTIYGSVANIATATATVAGGIVTVVTAGAAGAGYAATPVNIPVLVTPAAGTTCTTPAIVTATVAAGAVTGYTIVNGGTGYTGAATLTVQLPAPVAATAAVTFVGTAITAVTVTVAGSGYTAAPIVTIVGGGTVTTAGSVTATIAAGVVTGYTVVNGGNYTAAPTVTVQAPPNAAGSALAMSTGTTYTSFNEISMIAVSALANVSMASTGRTSTGAATTFQKLADAGSTNGTSGGPSTQMLFESTNTSATWQEIYSLPSSFGFGLSLSPSFATDNTMYLYGSPTAQNKIYKSIDGGATWNTVATYGGLAISGFAPIDGTNYWFSTASGIRSTLSTSAAFSTNSLAAAPLIVYSPTFFYAGTSDGDIWISTDGGNTFASLGVPAVTGVNVSTQLVSTTDVATKTIYVMDTASNIWSYTVGTSTSWTQFLSGSILVTPVGGATSGGITGIPVGNNTTMGTTTVCINKMYKATGAWYFVSNYNANGEVWRSTTLASGSFEPLPGSAYNSAATTSFGNGVAGLTIVNDKTTGNNTIYYMVAYNGTTVTPNSYNYKWITFTDSVLGAPTTTAPVASANTSATVDFSWKAVTNATSYDVQIAYDSAFNNIFLSHIATSSGLYPSTVWAQVALNPGQTYYWRVRVSVGSPMASAWSAGVMFTTQLGSVSSSGIDVGRYPTPGATAVSTNSFSWGTVAGATTYEFKISTKADFSDIVDSSVGLTGTVYQTLAKLTPGTTYFWEVRAVAGTVTGPWVTATFTTATAAQANPTTTAPVAVVTPTITVNIPTQPAATYTVVVPTQSNTSNSTPAWAWVVIAIAAVLVIAVIVLIARTRRV